jgi:hypothetical protein
MVIWLLIFLKCLWFWRKYCKPKMLLMNSNKLKNFLEAMFWCNLSPIKTFKFCFIMQQNHGFFFILNDSNVVVDMYGTQFIGAWHVILLKVLQVLIVQPSLKRIFHLTIWSMYHNHVNNEHVANEHGPKFVTVLGT